MIGDEIKETTKLKDLAIHDLRRSMLAGLERLGAQPHVIGWPWGTAIGASETGLCMAGGQRLGSCNTRATPSVT